MGEGVLAPYILVFGAGLLRTSSAEGVLNVPEM